MSRYATSNCHLIALYDEWKILILVSDQCVTFSLHAYTATIYLYHTDETIQMNSIMIIAIYKSIYGDQTMWSSSCALSDYDLLFVSLSLATAQNMPCDHLQWVSTYRIIYYKIAGSYKAVHAHNRYSINLFGISPVY